MAKVWRIAFQRDDHTGKPHFISAKGFCPFCRLMTSFRQRALEMGYLSPTIFRVYLLLRCDYAACGQTVFVRAKVHTDRIPIALTGNEIAVVPSASRELPHSSIPAEIVEDWMVAQRSAADGNPKAAAAMLRRVLYGVLIDKACKLKPLREGVPQLIAQARLPKVDNVVETLEYTAELLRYLYMGPLSSYSAKPEPLRQQLPPDAISLLSSEVARNNSLV